METNEKQTPFLKRIANLEEKIKMLEKRIETIIKAIKKIR